MSPRSALSLAIPIEFAVTPSDTRSAPDAVAAASELLSSGGGERDSRLTPQGAPAAQRTCQCQDCRYRALSSMAAQRTSVFGTVATLVLLVERSLSSAQTLAHLELARRGLKQLACVLWMDLFCLRPAATALHADSPSSTPEAFLTSTPTTRFLQRGRHLGYDTLC
ncbi:hypothetical protein RTBOTA2_006179 [Rhodotorula toruloides]|nr:hypothetical protein RTBOTA2_006179 [Rhodotorula toruloides]